MARPCREILQNVTYHCFSRCHNNRDLLRPEYVKKIVLQTVKKALVNYQFKLSYLEFANTRIHVVIKTMEGGATISRIMQYIKARIAEIYNRINNCTGSFWNERYKSEIIEKSSSPVDAFLRLIWYLSYQPVINGEMKNPRENPFSSIHAYLNRIKTGKIPLTCHEYYYMLGNSFEERKSKFEKYEREVLTELGRG